MTLKEFEKFMEKKHSAYWTSFSVQKKDKNGKIVYEPLGLQNAEKKYIKNWEDIRYKFEIDQLDSIGISRGVESRMIDLTVWVEELKEPIAITCKMLCSSFDECLTAIKEIKNILCPYF